MSPLFLFLNSEKPDFWKRRCVECQATFRREDGGGYSKEKGNAGLDLVGKGRRVGVLRE